MLPIYYKAEFEPWPWIGILLIVLIVGVTVRKTKTDPSFATKYNPLAEGGIKNRRLRIIILAIGGVSTALAAIFKFIDYFRGQ